MVLGYYVRMVGGGRFDALGNLLSPWASRLGGYTLSSLPGRIDAMIPEIEKATRIIFFTASNLQGLTAEEMKFIQSSTQLMQKTIFVFGSPP